MNEPDATILRPGQREHRIGGNGQSVNRLRMEAAVRLV
jgi:hypothetical protein